MAGGEENGSTLMGRFVRLCLMTPTSYVLCATPRTGSTLLCDLLASTGVAGRPESYFREPDETEWAERFDVEVQEGRVADYARFASAVRAVGTTPNGVFGVRIMWGSMTPLVARLSAAHRNRGASVDRGHRSPTLKTDLDVLTDTFGSLGFVHLRRMDVVRQAVSWARAEQTGYWQQGQVSREAPHVDLDRVEALVRMIHEHNVAWTGWFAARGIAPLRMTYEEVVIDPGSAVRQILANVGVTAPPNWKPASRHRRQADELNEEWARQYRAQHRLQ